MAAGMTSSFGRAGSVGSGIGTTEKRMQRIFEESRTSILANTVSSQCWNYCFVKISGLSNSSSLAGV